MDVYRLSRAAQRALDAAVAEARSLGHGHLDAGHLVLGLLAEKGAASVALGRAGIGRDALRAKMDEVYEGPREDRVRQVDRSAGEAREALELARDGAEAAGETDVAPVRLFLAATEDDGWTATRALAALGADVEKLRRAAEDLARDEAQGTLPE